MKKVKGKIGIARRRNSLSNKDTVVEDFGSVVTGLSGVDMEAKVYDTYRHVGGVREVKEEEVRYESTYNIDENKKAAEEAVKALEVDGWVGRVSDATNSHRMYRVEEGTMAAKVTFSRYLDSDRKVIED